MAVGIKGRRMVGEAQPAGLDKALKYVCLYTYVSPREYGCLPGQRSPFTFSK